MDNFNLEIKDYNVYITPKDGKYTYLIIFLHGKGDVAESYLFFFFGIEKVLPEDIPIKIILLQSPYAKVMFNRPLGTSWFNINEFPLVSRECYNFAEAEISKKKVENIIDEEAKLLNGK